MEAMLFLDRGLCRSTTIASYALLAVCFQQKVKDQQREMVGCMGSCCVEHLDYQKSVCLRQEIWIYVCLYKRLCSLPGLWWEDISTFFVTPLINAYHVQEFISLHEGISSQAIVFSPFFVVALNSRLRSVREGGCVVEKYGSLRMFCFSFSCFWGNCC